MKYLFLLCIVLSLYAEDDVTPISMGENSSKSTQESKSTESEEDIERANVDVVVVKDESGLSDDAVRKKAKESDEQKLSRVKLEDVVENIDEHGTIDISKIQKRWENLSPTPIKYDWVKTKSGEWFKGKIKALFDQELEFDSDEIGLYTFDFDDVVEIKSYHIINVNIENLASFPGIMRMKDGNVTIIQGENSYQFEKKDIISFAPDGDRERNYWSGNISFSFDIRQGNSNQYDYSAKGELKRRTASSRLEFSYLGRISAKNDVETTNNQRVSQKYDIYLTRKYFWTPLFSEYYEDVYKNIANQVTAGLGIGYTLYDRTHFEWNLSGGPAYLYTEYVTVPNANDTSVRAAAIEMSTKIDADLSKITELKFDYKMTLTKKNAGKFKHHMLLTLENKLLSWLDFDVTGIWDYVQNPETKSDGTIPLKSDFQILVGLGIEF